MTSFFGELRRRNVVKVAVAYAIVAWLLIQIADVVLPTFNAPEWVMQVFTFFMILGFPIALLLAWAYEMTPEGLRAASTVQPTESITHATGLMLNYFIVGLLVLAVGFVVVDQYVLDAEPALGDSESATITPRGNRVRRLSINIGPTSVLGDTGLNTHVSLSPDGQYLAYAASMDQSSGLYLRALDQFEARLLPGTQQAYHPFFSSDGQSIVFFSESDSTLKSVSVHGGRPRPLASDILFPGGGSWGPDDSIFFGTGTVTSGRSIFRISSPGETPEAIVRANDQVGYVWPQVLPGVRALLFTVRPGNGGGGPARSGYIGAVSLETGEHKTLVSGGYRPTYAPTGHLVFVRDGGLWAVPFDAEELETTGPEVLLIEGVQQEGTFGAAAYSFSTDGTLVYLPGADTTASPDRRLVWVTREGRQEALSFEQAPYFDPQLSPAPDEQRVAVTVVDDVGGRDVWILDLESGNTSRFTFDGVSQRPHWTPSGQRIIFHSQAAGRPPGLFWKASNGSGQVEHLSELSGPGRSDSFTPDGSAFVFSQLEQDWDVHLLPLEEERTAQPLIGSERNEYAASISPNGRYIAYTSDELGAEEVFVRPFPNVEGGKWQVSRNGGSGSVWRFDGRELFYRIGGTVMAVSIDAESTFSQGTPRALFTGNYVYDGGTSPSYAVSADGERFLMIQLASHVEDYSQQTALAVIENWFSELIRLAPPSE